MNDIKDAVHGNIAYFNLQDWWLNNFSDVERIYIIEKIGRSYFVHDKISSSSNKDAGFFLYSHASWFRSKSDKSIYERFNEKVAELGVSRPLSGPGYIRGRYFITYVYDVTNLERQDRLDEAESLLLELIDAEKDLRRVEKVKNPSPWYYEQLAIVYRKNKKYSDEISIIEKYLTQSDGGGIHYPKMLKRLEKAKKLLSKG